MDVSLGKRWEEFVEATVRQGRFGSASEVVREGLRLVAEREAKLSSLRETLDASVTQGGLNTDDDVEASIGQAVEALRQSGY